MKPEQISARETLDSELQELRWFCVRTKPKHEHIAAARLCQNLSLEVFNPRLRMERSTRRGLVRTAEPLFPCYVFVRCQLAERLNDIRYVTGVSSLVHFGEQIPAVPDVVINELRECFDTEDLLPVEERYRPGDEVRVTQGAFLGFHAIVLRVLPARRRVQILLEMLGRSTLVEVSRDMIAADNESLADLVPSLAA